MNKFTWQKGLVIPVALTLTIGGALVATVPANAAPADLVISSHTVSGNVLTVVGQGTVGDTVQLNLPGGAFYNRTTIPASGSFTITYTIPTATTGSQSYTVEQEASGFRDDGDVTFTAAAVPTIVTAFAVTTPTNGATLTSRTVTFSGTGTPGSTVSTVLADGSRFAGTNAVVGNDGTWSATGTFAATAPVDEAVTVAQTTGGGGNGSTVVNVVLPAPVVVSTFAVTSPAQGSTVTSRTVTVTGTGTPGSTVSTLLADGSRFAPANAVVGDDGTWSATGTFAASAPVDEAITVNQTTGGGGNGSTVLNIVLPAPVVVTTFAVTTPTEGQTLTSRTVTFTGTGTPGSTVATLLPDGSRFAPANAVVGDDGTWSATGTFAASAPVNEAITVNQTTGGSGGGSIVRDVVLPAPVVVTTFAVTTPTENEAVSSRTVTFTGTGTPGSTVSTLLPGGDRFDPNVAVVGNDGTWSSTGTFAADAPTNEAIRVTQVTGGSGTGDVTVDITLPAATTPPPVTAPAAPAITSPKNGQKLTGSSVTFSGTGTPGSNILLVAAPTAELKAAAAKVDEAQAKLAAPAAPAAPADPSAPIVVNSKGVWTVTVALKPNDYTAEATAFLVDSSGNPVLDGNGDPVTSGPSNDVEFVLAAAATTTASTGTTTTASTGTTTPATTATAASADGSLAFTGSNPAPIVGFAGLLLALGGVFTSLARRRRRLNG